MKNLLAVAKPNFSYQYVNNFKNIILEARLIGHKVMYYEVHVDGIKKGKEICLRQEIVHELFHCSRLIHERPFVMKPNRDFYAVLERHRSKYHDRFILLKEKTLNDKPELIRTRKPKLKRTKK